MLNLILIAFGIVFFSCQHKTDETTKKDLIIKDFLAYYIKYVLKNDSVVLLATTPVHNAKDCFFKITFEKEFNLFDETDMSTIMKKDGVIWDQTKIQNAIFISNTALPDINSQKAWVYFRKKFGEGYYSFSSPLVSKDLKYILFYAEYNCGPRCGYSNLGLYAKTKVGWKLVKKYCVRIS